MSPGPFPLPTPVLCDLGRSPVTASDLAAQVFPRFASSLRVGPLSLSSFWGLSGWTRVVGVPGPERERGGPWHGAREEQPWADVRAGPASSPCSLGAAALRAQGLPPPRHRLSHRDACEAWLHCPCPYKATPEPPPPRPGHASPPRSLSSRQWDTDVLTTVEAPNWAKRSIVSERVAPRMAGLTSETVTVWMGQSEGSGDGRL